MDTYHETDKTEGALTQPEVAQPTSDEHDYFTPLAPVSFVMYDRILKYNPQNPSWRNRDRVIISNHHHSLLQYSLLYLTGSLPDDQQTEAYLSQNNELSRYRELETRTGQTLFTAIGLAVAEEYLGSRFNKEDFTVINHYTYGLCNQQEVRDPSTHEAAALAGFMGLGKLICIYEELPQEVADNVYDPEEIVRQFEDLGWQVLDLGQMWSDTEVITTSFHHAQQHSERPTMIILRSNKTNLPTEQQHPILDNNKSSDEIIHNHLKNIIIRGMEAENEWRSMYRLYEDHFPGNKSLLEDSLALKVNIMKKIMDNVALH